MAKAFKIREPSGHLEVQGQNILILFGEEKPLSATNHTVEFLSCGYSLVSSKQLSL